MNTLPTTINEDLSNISKDSQSNPDSSIESPDNLSKVKKNQSKFRNHLKGLNLFVSLLL